MLFSRPGCLFLLCLTAGVLHTNAVPDDGAENSLLPTFTLLGGNGGSETGRCTGTDLDNLKASYEDMCLMARSASNELEFLLKQAEVTEGDGPPRPDDDAQVPVDNWKRWQRIRETYLSLFGQDPFVKKSDHSGPKKPGETILGHERTVQSFYNRVVGEFCSGRNANSPLLVCTDSHYKFIKVGESDPGDAQGQNIEATHPQCRNVGGVWYSQYMPQGQRYEEHPPPRDPEDGPICTDPDHLAVTIRLQNTIFFCKGGLDTNVHKTVTLQDLRSGVKPASRRYKKVDHDMFLQLLTLGRVTKLEDVKRVGGEIMPVTWLHELHHLLTRSDDEPAVDKGGNRIKDTENKYNPDTNQYEDQEVNQKAYGYDLSRDLALYGGISAMVNPDNSAFFALAMFFSEFDWSKGFAMPLKDHKAKKDD